MENKYYTTERSQQIVISLLKAHNIKKIIASPGTTNLTLVGSLQNDNFFEVYSSVDERSAAYLACGLAAESGEPVVLTCTGATASRNYMPGLTEAYYRKLPVLAITATQGNFKIGHHIAQVIDRRSIPNDIAKLSVDIPVTRSADDEWFTEIEVNKALLELRRNGGGPVHINLATTYSRDYSVKELPPTRIINRITICDTFPVLPKGKIGIFVGSHATWTPELTDAVESFCSSRDAVVFCDHTSGYRGKYHQLYSVVLGQRNYSSPITNVDVLIHIGEVTGDYSIGGIRAKQTWRVSEDGELRDPTRKLRYVFEMPEVYFFKHYVSDDILEDTFLSECQREHDLVSSAVSKKMDEIPFSNIWMAHTMSSQLPEKSVLHLGILNTLRSWNHFEVPDSVQVFCNVGGFGIDGDVSSLIGASLANSEKLYLGIIGDLAFFYDMNVIGNRHVGNNVRIMLINNGRGTEFRNYDHPGHEFGDAADAYIAAAGHYGNQSRNLVKHYAEDLGYEYISASTKEEFLSIYQKFLNPEITDRPILFEVFTNHEDESNALHMLRGSVSNVSGSLLNAGVKSAKKILGDSGFQSAVKVAKKLHIV